MIDEYWTWEFYGYHSYDWADGSNKPIVARCEGCCQYRILRKNGYSDFCRSCGRTGKRNPFFGKHHTDEAKREISDWFDSLSDEKKREINRKKSDWYENLTDEELHERQHKQRVSASTRPPASDIARHNMSMAQQRRPPISEEDRQRISAGHQGIPYEEWTGFVSNGKYCEKFDEACRERIRERYNRLCYVCDKNEEDNGQKLSVHHTDMNKNQGCDGVLWKLVPLCRECHSTSRGEPLKTLIEYLLNDEDV